MRLLCLYGVTLISLFKIDGIVIILSESPSTIISVVVHRVFDTCPRAAGADIFDHVDGMLTFYNWVIHEETAAWPVLFCTPTCGYGSAWVKIFKTQETT